MIDGERDVVIVSGYHLVNRIGYILTAVPRETDGMIYVELD